MEAGESCVAISWLTPGFRRTKRGGVNFCLQYPIAGKERATKSERSKERERERERELELENYILPGFSLGSVKNLSNN